MKEMWEKYRIFKKGGPRDGKHESEGGGAVGVQEEGRREDRRGEEIE